MPIPSKPSVSSNSVHRLFSSQGLVALASISLLLSACVGDIEIGFGEDGSGAITEEAQQLPDFDSIEVGGIYEVSIVVDPNSDSSVSIVTDDNLHDNLDIRVEGTVLKLAIDAGLEPSNRLLAEVVVPSLDYVTADGVAHIAIAGDTTAGNFAVQLTSSGASTIDSSGYQASAASVEASGVSTLTVWASGEVRGSASGASTITVKDAGSIHLTTSGIAEVN